MGRNWTEEFRNIFINTSVVLIYETTFNNYISGSNRKVCKSEGKFITAKGKISKVR